MGRREARKVEDRIHLDTLIRVKVYSGERDRTTGRYLSPTTDVQVWAAVEDGRSDLKIERDMSLATFPQGYVVRWDARWATLGDRRVTVTVDDREHRIATVTRIGRRRFLRLEVKA